MLKGKTLFIGPFKDTSGYASAARNYAKALILNGETENLVLRSVRYDVGNKSVLPKLLQVFHDKSSFGAETIIQMLTPNEMRPVEGKRNIAICCWETDKIPQHWVEQLNKFDAIIVPCEANRDAFQTSGVTKSIYVVPFTFFADDYIKDFGKFVFPFPTEETVIYYNISQWSHKKGIDALLRGYFSAFQNDENVLLVLKGYINMKNQNGDLQKMMTEVEQIKQAMRLKKYPKVYIVDAMMTDEEVYKLHNSCNIYINTSRGEGWGVPPFEALLLGNELVSVKHTGMSMYLNPDQYYHVESRIEPVFNMPHPDPELYTAKENWMEPEVYSLINALKASYNTLSKKNNKVKAANMLSKFDPKIVAGQLVEVMNG